MEEIKLRCRTCLKSNTKLCSLFKLIPKSNPSQTYDQFLTEYTQLEVITLSKSCKDDTTKYLITAYCGTKS